MKTFATGILATLFSGLIGHATSTPEYVTTSNVIYQQVIDGDYLSRNMVPEDLASRLGAAHVSGKYHFTDLPFLIEGCKDLQKLGFGAVKLWFTKIAEAYPFNSQWNLPSNHTLVELAKHPYFEEAFAMPFDTFALEVQPVKSGKPHHGFAMDPASDFSEDEKQVYDLSVYLLTKYKDRPVTFIFQNWEGDWMLRGGAKDAWDQGEYPDLELRAETFIRWLQARQRGVERARAEHPDSKSQVLHAVEVNRVLDTWDGIPTLTSHVLPYAKTDMVSWSCYDGMRNHKRSIEHTAVGLWQGIETIKHFARSAHDGADVPVFLGEIGIPEQKGFDDEQIKAIWDGAFAVSFAMDLPYIFQWQLYDNEIRDGIPNTKETYSAEELNGYWIRLPDGNLSTTGKYLVNLLEKSSSLPSQ